MDLVILLGTALALAMDAFAVAAAVAASLEALHRRQVFRLAWHFGLFQFMMPVAGWAAGAAVAARLAEVDHWIVMALLGMLGGRMIWSSFSDQEKRVRTDPTRGLSLVLLSVATSIDALAVGVSLGLLHVDIWAPALVIGAVAAAMTLLGTQLGHRIGRSLGRWAERAGGLVLVGIGLRILISHLTA